jgi:hypothetical protein
MFHISLNETPYIELEKSKTVRKCNSMLGTSCQDEVFLSLHDGHCHVTEPLISKYPLQIHGLTAHSGNQRRNASSLVQCIAAILKYPSPS